MFRLPRRLLHGFAAVLALALSAFGGARLGIERAVSATDPSDERPAYVRSASAVEAHAAAIVAAAAPAAAPVVAAPTSTPARVAAATARDGAVPCALLLGSALGPRAP